MLKPKKCGNTPPLPASFEGQDHPPNFHWVLPHENLQEVHQVSRPNSERPPPDLQDRGPPKDHHDLERYQDLLEEVQEDHRVELDLGSCDPRHKVAVSQQSCGEKRRRAPKSPFLHLEKDRPRP